MNGRHSNRPASGCGCDGGPRPIPRPRSHRRLACGLAAVSLIAAISSLLLAQQQVGSGHALDASLEVGSYGYNGYTGGRSALASRTYSPYRGASRQYLYQGEASGAAAWRDNNGNYNTPFNTYLNDRYYAPVWSSGANAYTSQGAGGGNSGLRIDYRVGG